jgi:regulator of protease activity HflC (stomatin/prohibitin superfamily)
MGCAIISESTVGSIERFGKFDRMIYPGFHFYNICTEKVDKVVSLKVQTSEILVETVTKESLSITIKVGIETKVATKAFRSKGGFAERYNESTALLSDSKSSYSGISSTIDPAYLAMYTSVSPLKQIQQTYFGIF